MKQTNQSSTEKSRTPLFKATIGFDFLFTKGNNGDRRILCLELNGEDSYIPINEIENWDTDEETKERVRNRMIYNPERVRRAQYAERLGSDVAPEIKKQAWAHAREVYVFENAIRNEPYIKNLVNNKKVQAEFIPHYYQPRTYMPGESPVSSTGFWICKPSGGQRAKGIYILANEAFTNTFINTGLENTYVAQEFITALGADNAPVTMKDHPAILRLVMDIEYFEDETVNELFTWANQSISPYSMNDIKIGHSMEEVSVITVAERNAKVVTASDAEFQMAHNAGLEIIRNIGKRLHAIKERF